MFAIHRSTFERRPQKGAQGIAVLNDKTRNRGTERSKKENRGSEKSEKKEERKKKKKKTDGKEERDEGMKKRNNISVPFGPFLEGSKKIAATVQITSINCHYTGSQLPEGFHYVAADSIQFSI